MYVSGTLWYMYLVQYYLVWQRVSYYGGIMYVVVGYYVISRIVAGVEAADDGALTRKQVDVATLNFPLRFLMNLFGAAYVVQVHYKVV